MQIEFKVTTTPEEYKELLPYTNAIERDLFLFELFYNFSKRWKHSDIEPTLDEVMETIFELKEKYKVIID